MGEKPIPKTLKGGHVSAPTSKPKQDSNRHRPNAGGKPAPAGVTPAPTKGGAINKGSLPA